MAEVTNQDILNAIRGLYNNQPNLVQLSGSIVTEALFDGTIDIAPGATWESARFDNLAGFNFVRFNLIFNATIKPEDVRVRLREVHIGGPLNGNAVGMTRTIPLVSNPSVSGSSNRDLTCGDIPIYYDSYVIDIQNNTANPITLRRIDSRRLK